MRRFFLVFLKFGYHRKILLLFFLSSVFLALLVSLFLFEKKQSKIILLHFDKFTLPINITLEINPSLYDISNLKKDIHAILNADSLIYNFYDPRSEISKLNQQPIFEKLTVSEKLYTILQESQIIYSILPTFDPGIGCLEQALKMNANIENQELKRQCAYKTGIRYIKFFDNFQIYKTREIQIDLGAIEKGKFMEDILHYLKMHSISSGIIEIGGDLLTFGNKNWKIGVISPKNKKISYILLVNNKAVATSGNYERYFENGGVKKNHIVNPYLLTSEMIDIPKSITVIGDNPSFVDAIATGLFLLTPQEAKKIKPKLLSLGKFDFFYLIDSHLEIEQSYNLFDIEKIN